VDVRRACAVQPVTENLRFSISPDPHSLGCLAQRREAVPVAQGRPMWPGCPRGATTIEGGCFARRSRRKRYSAFSSRAEQLRVSNGASQSEQAGETASFRALLAVRPADFRKGNLAKAADTEVLSRMHQGGCGPFPELNFGCFSAYRGSQPKRRSTSD
jgi:hypothetical protein